MNSDINSKYFFYINSSILQYYRSAMILVTFTTLLAVAAALGQLLYPKDARILQSEFQNDGTGSYRYGFQSSDGIQREEQGLLVNPQTKNEALVVRGSYSYPGPDGVVYAVRYTADENGFHPEGDHIKVPPFVPWTNHQHHQETQAAGNVDAKIAVPKPFATFQSNPIINNAFLQSSPETINGQFDSSTNKPLVPFNQFQTAPGNPTVSPQFISSTPEPFTANFGSSLDSSQPIINQFGSSTAKPLIGFNQFQTALGNPTVSPQFIPSTPEPFVANFGTSFGSSQPTINQFGSSTAKPLIGFNQFQTALGNPTVSSQFSSSTPEPFTANFGTSFGSSQPIINQFGSSTAKPLIGFNQFQTALGNPTISNQFNQNSPDQFTVNFGQFDQSKPIINRLGSSTIKPLIPFNQFQTARGNPTISSQFIQTTPGPFTANFGTSFDPFSFISSTPSPIQFGSSGLASINSFPTSTVNPLGSLTSQFISTTPRPSDLPGVDQVTPRNLISEQGFQVSNHPNSVIEVLNQSVVKRKVK